MAACLAAGNASLSELPPPEQAAKVPINCESSSPLAAMLVMCNEGRGAAGQTRREPTPPCVCPSVLCAPFSQPQSILIVLCNLQTRTAAVCCWCATTASHTWAPSRCKRCSSSTCRGSRWGGLAAAAAKNALALRGMQAQACCVPSFAGSR